MSKKKRTKAILKGLKKVTVHGGRKNKLINISSLKSIVSYKVGKNGFPAPNFIHC